MKKEKNIMACGCVKTEDNFDSNNNDSNVKFTDIADMKAKQQYNSFTRSWACLQICELCRASKRGPNYFSDYRETAAWLKTLETTEEYMRKEGLSAFVKMPGFSLELNLPDSLHNLYLARPRQTVATGNRQLATKVAKLKCNMPAVLQIH